MRSRNPLSTLRALYFFHAATSGLLVPYLAPFLETRGVEGPAQGALLAMRMGIAIALGPLVGMAADRFGAGRTLRVATSLGTIAVAMQLLATEPIHFVPIFAMTAVLATVSFLVDAAILGVLENEPAASGLGGAEAFGRSRLYGSIGFAVAALAFGFLWRDAPQEVSAWAAMLAVAVLTAMSMTLSFAIPPAGHVAIRPRFADISRMLRCPGVPQVLLTGALHWITLAPYHAFFGAHLQHHGGGPATIGLSIGVSVAVEVALMATAPRWLSRFSSRHLLAAGAAAGVVRWSLTAVGSPGVIIAAQVLHGLSYGIFYLAMVDAIVRRTPPELRGTSQALIAAVAIGGGTLAGNLIAGRLYAIDQGRTLFLAAAAFSVVPAIAALLIPRDQSSRIRISGIRPS